MWQITFDFSDRLENPAIQLRPGRYAASVELLSTNPVQYRVFDIQSESGNERHADDQLLLMRLQQPGLEIFEWLEVFNNSSSALAQLIGRKIEEKERLAN